MSPFSKWLHDALPEKLLTSELMGKLLTSEWGSVLPDFLFEPPKAPTVAGFYVTSAGEFHASPPPQAESVVDLAGNTWTQGESVPIYGGPGVVYTSISHGNVFTAAFSGYSFNMGAWPGQTIADEAVLQDAKGAEVIIRDPTVSPYHLFGKTFERGEVDVTRNLVVYREVVSKPKVERGRARAMELPVRED